MVPFELIVDPLQIGLQMGNPVIRFPHLPIVLIAIEIGSWPLNSIKTNLSSRQIIQPTGDTYPLGMMVSPTFWSITIMESVIFITLLVASIFFCFKFVGFIARILNKKGQGLGKRIGTLSSAGRVGAGAISTASAFPSSIKWDLYDTPTFIRQGKSFDWSLGCTKVVEAIAAVPQRAKSKVTDMAAIGQLFEVIA